MRVVFDTNVLLPALFSRGVCEVLFDRCRAPGMCEIVLSEHILGEFEEHAHNFRVTEDQVKTAIDYLRRKATMVEPAPVAATRLMDPDDIPVLGTAVAAKAHVLVTGDADLLRLERFGEIAIISPRALMLELA